MAAADLNDVANLIQSPQWQARVGAAMIEQAYASAQFNSVDPLVKALAQRILAPGGYLTNVDAFARAVGVYIGQTQGFSSNSTITDALILTSVATAFPYVAGG